MYPAIRPRDVAVVRTVGWTGIRRGDVVLFESESRLTAHRVLVPPIDASSPIVTKGDTLPYYDPPVRPAQLLGRIDALERGRRTIRLASGAAVIVQWLMADLSGPWAALFWKGASLRRRILKGMVGLRPYRAVRRRRFRDRAEIRPYRAAEDADGLTNCLRELQPRSSVAEWWDRIEKTTAETGDAGGRTWICLDGPRIVGVATLVPGEPSLPARVTGWYVHPAARGCGWGDRLIETVENACVASRESDVSAAVPTNSPAAKRLLRKRGWGLVDRRPNRSGESWLLSDDGESIETWIRAVGDTRPSDGCYHGDDDDHDDARATRKSGE